MARLNPLKAEWAATGQVNITGSHGPSPAIRELEIYGKAE